MASAREQQVQALVDGTPWVPSHLPLHGVSVERAELIRETLRGYPVRFWSVADSRGDPGTLGVFAWVYLPGEQVWGGFAFAWDIVIYTGWTERDSGPACGSGSARHLGPAALWHLEVLSMDAWRPCGRCGAWRPREALHDVDRWMLDDPHLADEYRGLWMCEENDEGYCV